MIPQSHLIFFSTIANLHLRLRLTNFIGYQKTPRYLPHYHLVLPLDLVPLMTLLYSSLRLFSFLTFQLRFPTKIIQNNFLIIYKITRHQLMKHRTKRQQFAQQLRQQHRKNIIGQHRNQPTKNQIHQITAFPYYNQIMNYQKLVPQQKSINKFQYADTECTQSMMYNKQQLLDFYQKSLKNLPPYIASIKNKANEDYNKICEKVLYLCYDALIRQICIKQSTQCLIELTTLENLENIFYKNQIMPNLLNYLAKMTNINENMQIILNCCYIIGNLFEFIVTYRQFLYPKINVQDQILEQIEYVVINNLQRVCAACPFYNQCLLLLTWFLRNCLLVIIKLSKQQPSHQKQAIQLENPPKYNTQKLCHTSTILIKSVIITCCSNLTPQTLKNKLTFKQQYLITSICQALDLISLIIVYSPTMYKINQSYIHNQLIWQIDQMLNVIFNNDYLMDNFVITDALSNVCSNLCNLVYLSVHKNNVKSVSVLEKFCYYVSSGKISGSTCFKVCSQVIQYYYTKPTVRNQLIKNIFINFEYFYKTNKQYIKNRDRRICLLELINTLLDIMPISEIKQIISQSLFKCSYNRIVIEQQIQLYFRKQFLPILFNMSELCIIDSDRNVVEMVLKIIGKLVENWEIDKQMVSSIIQEQGLHLHILSILQDNCPENIFDAATSVLDTLQIS